MAGNAGDESKDAAPPGSGEPAPIPRTPAVIAAEQRLESSRIWVLLFIVAYGAAGALIEWWPINWLNLAQQRVFGAYQPRISAILFILVASIGQTLLWSKLEVVVTRRIADRTGATETIDVPPPTFIAPTARRPDSQRLVRWGLITIVAIWVAAGTAFWWFDTQQRDDNRATYTPLSLDASAPVHVSQGDHMSVHGMVLASRAVTFRSTSGSDSPDYVLIPLVPRDWRSGDSVRVLLQVDARSTLPGYQPMSPNRPWMLPESVLGRVRGSAPLIARKEFKDMNVPLTRDNQVLEVIASQGGKPVQRHVDYFEPILWMAGIGSLAIAIMFGAAAVIWRRRERAGWVY